MSNPQTASGTTRDKEGKSYVDSPTRGDNYTAQEVYVGNTSNNPVVVTTSVSWDKIETTFPTLTQGLYTYKRNSNVVMTVLVSYLDESRKEIISIDKTVF